MKRKRWEVEDLRTGIKGERPPQKLARQIIAFLVAPVVFLVSPLNFTVVSQSPREAAAIVLAIDGAVGPATTLYLRQGFAVAARRNAAVIVLRMNTPGGLDSAMREIIGDILASPIPVITYVAPRGARAASAGTYILYASQLAAMAPGTHLGAATPVQLGGGRQPFGGGAEPDETKRSKDGGQAPADAATTKAVNDAVAYIRGLAELNERNADWAERAVRQAATLTATAALDQGVIEIIADDLPDLFEKVNGREVQVQGKTVQLDTAGLAVETLAPNWRAQLLAAITNPNIAYILLLIGFYGILFEFFNPGTFFSGVIGAIALLTALFALNLMPINFAGVALIGLGVALMVAEAFAPSFGILGIGGAVSLVLGSLFLFDDVPGFTISLPVILTATAVSALILIIGLTAALRSFRHKVVTGEPALIGSAGQVLEWANGQGQVLVHGERWQAHSSNDFVPGQRVCVKAREGLTLFVEPDSSPLFSGESHARD